MNERRPSWCGLLAMPFVAIVAIVAACQPSVPSPPPTQAPPSAAGTAAATPALPTPGPSATAAAVQLPDPGGTCNRNQFAEGTAGSSYNFSTLFSRVADAWQPLTNVGDVCVLAVPSVIGMAGAGSPFEAIALPNAGQEVCVKNACKFVYPASYRIASGDSVTLWLRASWPWSYGEGTPLPPSCDHPLSEVTAAMFPFASGVLTLTWETPFHEVCPAAGSIGITVGTT
jgi:hypothetical protein